MIFYWKIRIIQRPLPARPGRTHDLAQRPNSSCEGSLFPVCVCVCDSNGVYSSVICYLFVSLFNRLLPCETVRLGEMNRTACVSYNT